MPATTGMAGFSASSVTSGMATSESKVVSGIAVFVLHVMGLPSLCAVAYDCFLYTFYNICVILMNLDVK
jgi:hypothetical protein